MFKRQWLPLERHWLRHVGIKAGDASMEVLEGKAGDLLSKNLNLAVLE
jgi:hypothetical protein